MAKTMEWLNTILDYMKKVKFNISTVFGLSSYAWTANLKVTGSISTRRCDLGHF